MTFSDFGRPTAYEKQFFKPHRSLQALLHKILLFSLALGVAGPADATFSDFGRRSASQEQFFKPHQNLQQAPLCKTILFHWPWQMLALQT